MRKQLRIVNISLVHFLATGVEKCTKPYYSNPEENKRTYWRWYKKMEITEEMHQLARLALAGRRQDIQLFSE